MARNEVWKRRKVTKDHPVMASCKDWSPLQQAPDANPPGPAYDLQFEELQLEPRSTAEEKFVSQNSAVLEVRKEEKGETHVADEK